jgi:hypothetical protein
VQVSGAGGGALRANKRLRRGLHFFMSLRAMRRFMKNCYEISPRGTKIQKKFKERIGGGQVRFWDEIQKVKNCFSPP